MNLRPNTASATGLELMLPSCMSVQFIPLHLRGEVPRLDVAQTRYSFPRPSGDSFSDSVFTYLEEVSLPLLTCFVPALKFQRQGLQHVFTYLDAVSLLYLTCFVLTFY